jgi:hypothetical protein
LKVCAYGHLLKFSAEERLTPRTHAQGGAALFLQANISFQRQKWIRNAAMKIASTASYASSPKSVASTNTIMT